MSLPRKRRRAKMGVRVSDIVRSPGHKKFVRQHHCAVPHCPAEEVDPHHIYLPGDAKSRKPPDSRTVPLCRDHHIECGSNLAWGEQIAGRLAFEAKYKIDLLNIAEMLWQLDHYHRMQWERKRREAELAGAG